MSIMYYNSRTPMGKPREKVDVSIIAPAYNEAEGINLFLKELFRVIRNYKFTAEVIIVDDGSSDGTSKAINNKYQRKVYLIKNKKNLGQDASIKKALKVARGEVAFVLDSDLQDPPELIGMFLKEIKKHDVVFGKRISRKDTLFKKITAHLYYRILRIFIPKVTLDAGNFFVARRAVYKKVARLPGPIQIRTIFAILGESIGEVEYERGGRNRGKTGYNIARMISLALLGLKMRKYQRKGKIAIVGGGFQGLVIGYFLTRKGHEVTIFEKEPVLGGIMTEVSLGGAKVDKTYHHLFRTDFYFRALLRELGLGKTCWQKVQMVNLTEKGLISTEKYLGKLLGPVAVLRFYFGILVTTFWSFSPKSSKSVTAENFIRKIFGKRIWESYFKIIFEKKFEKFAREILAEWFAHRIRKRFFSQTFGGEVLGYPEKGFTKVIKKLEEKIKESGGEIKVGEKVTKIEKKAFGFVVAGEYFDTLIDTRPPEGISYFSYVGIIIRTKKDFGDFFWANNLSGAGPTAIINTSSLVNLDGGCYYVGKYTSPKSSYYKKTDIWLKNDLLMFFKKALNVPEKEILEVVFTRIHEAQPIILGKSSVPKIRLAKNHYALSMAHIFPEDRGLESAVKYAKKITRNLTKHGTM